MSKNHPRRGRRLGAAAVTVAVGSMVAVLPASAAGPGTMTGPRTTVDPYLEPVAAGVTIESLLTVHDLPARNGYAMVGIPDGLGAVRRDVDGRVIVHMNQELGASNGIVRKHGQKGAFVSRYVIDPTTHDVLHGSDLTSVVTYFDRSTGTYTTTPTTGVLALSRLCSSSQGAPGQFFNAGTGNGTTEPIYFAGEESGSEGRAFATLRSGATRELPRAGRFSFENLVPATNASDTTVLVGSDDQFDGRVLVYRGTKTSAGGPLARAGLLNGNVANIKLDGIATDAAFRAAHDVGDEVPFGLVGVDWKLTGAQQKAQADAAGALRLNRVEDGAFDPANPDDFYFITTDGGEGSTSGGGGGLWRLRFADIDQPELGGTLTLLMDGTEAIGANKPDNLTIADGNIVIQEDPGGDDVLARIYAYRIADGAVGEIAVFDADRFTPGAPAFMTNDEESSGIIPADDLLGAGWFLLDAQVHTSAGLPAGTGPGTVEELVQHGQLLAMQVTDWSAVYGS